MNKIILKNHDSKKSNEIVYNALIRSFTKNQIDIESSDIIISNGLVLIKPDKSNIELLKRFIYHGSKILILGDLYNDISYEIGININGNPESFWNKLEEERGFTASSAYIEYEESNINYGKRYLERYDFEKEWNNIGYGKIGTGGDIWDISCIAEEKGIKPIAWINNKNGEKLSLYAGIKDFEKSSVLWFNRSVGPVDSLEWNIVEDFFSSYRSEELPCFPCISEIPYGYNGVVTMHIDCDEAISSARPLFELYGKYNLPFSIAVKTGQQIDSEDIKFIKDVINSGGSVTSHSINHYVNWGGNEDAAYSEAMGSKKWIEDNTGYTINYAVSPFYQNPPYAVNALAKAGYKGFIGGIICNDPEYLIAKSGIVPFTESNIISHSEQCMLHGDCFHRYNNSIEPYIEAFNNHLKCKTIFGYLDHPFSDRYWYGWKNEEERLKVHEEFLEYILNSGKIWFASLDNCMDFIFDKSKLQVFVNESDNLEIENPSGCNNFVIKWKGLEKTIS